MVALFNVSKNLGLDFLAHILYIIAGRLIPYRKKYHSSERTEHIRIGQNDFRMLKNVAIISSLDKEYIAKYRTMDEAMHGIRKLNLEFKKAHVDIVKKLYLYQAKL